MTRLAAVMLLTGTALGCYVSEVPIDPKPQADIDHALVGTWRCLPFGSSSDAEAATLTVGPAANLVYGIRLQEGQKEPERYEAHASLVKGTTLLNVKDLDPRVPVKPWTFARYSLLLPDVLHVQIVGRKLLKGVAASPASLRQTLEQLHEERELYEYLMLCVRVTQAAKRGADATGGDLRPGTKPTPLGGPAL
jgi:hypothetical protein